MPKFVADSAETTGLKWQAPASTAFVGAAVYNSVAQSISNTTFTALTWDSEYFDTDAFHSTSSNTSRMTIPSGKNGKYRVSAYVQADNNATGKRIFYIYKNGSMILEITRIIASTVYPTLTGTAIFDLVATDYLELFYFQDSGTSKDVGKEDKYGRFELEYLGA